MIELTRKLAQGSEKQRCYTRNSAKGGGVRIKYEVRGIYASEELNCRRGMPEKIYMREKRIFLARTTFKSKEKSKRY